MIMIKRRTFIKASTVLAALVASVPYAVRAQQEIPVVATFSILGNMVERIGGSAVSVTTLVGRNGDTHVFQPTPADAKAVKRASVLFTNGLEFEGWLDRLAEAAEFDGELVVTTNGIETISLQEHGDDEHGDGGGEDEKQHDDEETESKDDHDGETQSDDNDSNEDEEHNGDEHDDHHNGEFDPHGWQSLQNAIVYVDNITAALAKTSPSNASTFYANRAAYVEEIESLDREIRNMIAALPTSARTIVTSHDAFQYFGRDYGLTFLAPQGLSTESEASARDVAQLIEQIRAEKISAVFVENVADPRLVQQIATETGSIVGGKLFPGALSNEDGAAATYLDMMRHNATTIATALTEAIKP
jgi:zinc/manganese transport system substrate-binding protein